MVKAHKLYGIYRLSPDFGSQGFVTYSDSPSNIPGVKSNDVVMMSTGTIGTDKMKLEQVGTVAYKTKKEAVKAMEELPPIGFYTLLEVYLTIEENDKN